MASGRGAEGPGPSVTEVPTVVPSSVRLGVTLPGMGIMAAASLAGFSAPQVRKMSIFGLSVTNVLQMDH